MGRNIRLPILLVSRKLLHEQVAIFNRKRGCRGSHVFLKHDDGRATVVPIHSGETIGPGLLSKILRDVEMTKDELLKILEGRLPD
ncbi:MAG TPA: type II toxin-antitoxin system HicA family toxin [Thermodesulfobacteriota bacterium]|nr:type II toxin-antitoxin system HicA family toxin [Thermodesulfobacteriota bacterium]